MAELKPCPFAVVRSWTFAKVNICGGSGVAMLIVVHRVAMSTTKRMQSKFGTGG